MKNTLYDTDEAIIAGIRKDDDKALAYLYKLHFPMISHFILNNSGTEDEAKDIYQEGVIVFYEKIKDNSLELTCQIKTYLYSVCRRLWLKRLAEKGRYAVKVDDAEDFLFVEEEVAQHEENERQFNMMGDALAQLGEPCRSLIEAYYIHMQNMQDITDKFGYTNSDTAKNQKYKCLQRLKKLFFTAYKPQV
ncbi:sigma-70 family RNA polymerase sigma factor [Pontibacter qinzhouensis]|uniref:Sigma-70 family RNA polymerase sigma factor n=1 Tax=Pontibacter qinzhouensis TaxID=2603253 RepID=A0A5C8KAY3_9BACT|nr:sigma-70 family RNA polymerase sigma factor [Pontibacter qinzhouensis]TXK52104.1 sigma-70 family RNA polymerase sigma factor [Pontibacter qinzhouensis]